MPDVVTNMTVHQGPLTNSMPLNVSAGLTAAGLINTGTIKLSGDDPTSSIMGILLNLIMQPLKKVLPFLRHAEWAIPAMLIVALVVSVYFLHPEDHTKAFKDAVLGVFNALSNYKTDKLSGLNILKSAEDG